MGVVVVVVGDRRVLLRSLSHGGSQAGLPEGGVALHQRPSSSSDKMQDVLPLLVLSPFATGW